MARKKKETTMDTNGPPLALPVEQQTAETQAAMPVNESPPADEPIAPAHQAPAPVAPSAQTGNGGRRPAVSWKYPAAAGVTVEVALWPHAITLQSGETIEVFNATITRNYRDAQGQWQKGGSFRISEIPVLVHALLRAHGFALDAREQTCPV